MIVRVLNLKYRVACRRLGIFNKFQIMSKVKTTDLQFNCCWLNILWPFAWWLQNLLYQLALDRKWSLLLFGSQGQGQTTVLHLKCYPLNILWTFSLIVTKLGTLVATREWMIIIDFSGHKINVKVKLCLSWYIKISAHWLTNSFR